MTIVFVFPLIAQEKDHEISSEVKELSAFHDVIYPIWHTAWPEKDIKLLQSFVPDVEKGYAKIKSAELPGILRDKKQKWEEGLKKFTEYVNNYKTAAAARDSVALLNAAEKLHAQYEVLAKIIKPLTKEVDAFHQVLYKLYHYYSPNNEYAKIKESAIMLKAKAEDLMKSQLPKKLEAKSETFAKVRAELLSAVEKLNMVVSAGNNKAEIEKAVEGVHSRYSELEKVFD